MKAKRMLSLVMAAVLALCVLAGCRGGRALSQVMAGLLEGQYAAAIAIPMACLMKSKMAVKLKT